jgi:hypothetical protein
MSADWYYFFKPFQLSIPCLLCPDEFGTFCCLKNNGKKGNNNTTASTEALTPPSLSSPPPLETARIYSHHSTPPDSSPPLAQATLPATASIPLASSRMQQSSPGRSSPDTAYPPSDHHLVSLQSQGLSNPPNYNYRSGTTTYQEQSQGPGYTYVRPPRRFFCVYLFLSFYLTYSTVKCKPFFTSIFSLTPFLATDTHGAHLFGLP